MPAVRSATNAPTGNLEAWYRATGKAVACSSASRVKSIRSAFGNFVFARSRSSHCVNAQAASSGLMAFATA